MAYLIYSKDSALNDLRPGQLAIAFNDSHYYKTLEALVSAHQTLGQITFKFYQGIFFPFFIRYLAHLHFQCYTKSPPYPSTPTHLPTHSPFLALAFPCTGAYTVCMSNGPLFPVMAD